jgi:hypothetical protein
MCKLSTCKPSWEGATAGAGQQRRIGRGSVASAFAPVATKLVRATNAVSNFCLENLQYSARPTTQNAGNRRAVRLTA